MIPGLLTPWLILAVILALGGSWAAGNYQGHKAESAAWERVQAQERADAATLQAKAEKAAHDADLRADEAARTIEETHAKDMADADATRADFTERLRAATRPRRCDGLPTAAANPGGGADVADGGQPGFRGPDPGVSIRDAALILQSYVKACHSWAVENGR